MMERPIWDDYVIMYPYDDEPDYDGIHDGGIKGLRDDAPEEAKKAFDEYMEATHSGEMWLKI